MQIGLECFKDEQLNSMIASNNRLGNCDITNNKDCLVYDTEDDCYLKEYLNEILDVFTVAKYLKIADTDIRVGYLQDFLEKWRLLA